MSVMEEDTLIQSLTQEGPNFEANWALFLFNLEMALKLKKKTKEEVMAVLQAGSQWTGTGWNTGRASKVLWDLSGVAIVRSQITHYRDCWLFALALLCKVELPMVELPQEVAGAAFSLVGYVEHPQGQEGQQHDQQDQQLEIDSDDTEEEMAFPWDAPAVDLPEALAALWARSSDPGRKIQMKALLEAFPPLEGLPARPPENNLLPDHKKHADTKLRVTSQQVLHVMRLLAHRFRGPLDMTVDMQIWQYLGELYHTLQAQRKDLSVPGSSQASATSSSGQLFTDEDVKLAKQQQQLSNLNKGKGLNFSSEEKVSQISMGGFSHAPNGHSFPVPAGYKGGKGYKSFGSGHGRGGQWHYPKHQVPIKVVVGMQT